jgi:hypothetical protein
MARCPGCRQVAEGDECAVCGTALTEAGHKRKAAARVQSAVSAIQNFGATLQDDGLLAEDMEEIHRTFQAAGLAQPVPVAPADPAAPAPTPSARPKVMTVPPKPRE